MVSPIPPIPRFPPNREDPQPPARPPRPRPLASVPLVPLHELGVEPDWAARLVVVGILLCAAVGIVAAVAIAMHHPINAELP